jgi:hypothetical protein
MHGCRQLAVQTGLDVRASIGQFLNIQIDVVIQFPGIVTHFGSTEVEPQKGSA